MDMSALPTRMYLLNAHGDQRKVLDLGTGFRNGLELPCGFWELNPGLLTTVHLPSPMPVFRRGWGRSGSAEKALAAQTCGSHSIPSTHMKSKHDIDLHICANTPSHMNTSTSTREINKTLCLS